MPEPAFIFLLMEFTPSLSPATVGQKETNPNRRKHDGKRNFRRRAEQSQCGHRRR